MSALLVGVMISIAARRGAVFIERYAIVVVFGLAAGLATHGLQWNWMYFPERYTAVLLADVIGGWLLAGIALAGVIKKAKKKPGAA